MRILLLGSGGREHALAWKIAASPLVTKLWCGPGNAGIAREAECVALDIADHAAVIDFCKANAVDFVVVGPETPLAAGIVDDLAASGIKAFGPSKQAAQLEGSKGFTMALCDGDTAIALASAQDHKRAFDHDQGPNTGGMGAYSPTPFVTPEIHAEIMARIILPTVAGMKARGTPFRGVLYAGVMLTPEGPKLFEYNVRFGDPECQVLMLRMMSDIVPALLASCDGQLKHFDLRWFPDPALTVVMAAKGYPGDYARGTRIGGLDDAATIEGVEIFHAGTVARDSAVL